MEYCRYYNKQGEEISRQCAYELYKDIEYRTVKKTIIGNFLISTVWLKFDHSYNNDILIFETMVFEIDDKNNIENGYAYDEKRHSTLEECEIEHEIMVKKWKERPLNKNLKIVVNYECDKEDGVYVSLEKLKLFLQSSFKCIKNISIDGVE